MLEFLLSLINKLKNNLLNSLKINLLYCINAIKNYMNPLLDRMNKLIYKDNNKKSGIYMFTNKLNNKRYIGSTINLHKRISRYFQNSYLKNSKHQNHLIIKAIKKNIELKIFLFLLLNILILMKIIL
jgi:GIY-YIG catalytic domain